MSNSFIRGDFKKLSKMIKSISKKVYVDVGILKGNIHPDSNVSVAYIGAVHEFGTDKAGRGNNTRIPERSFIRMPLEEKSEKITKLVEKKIEILLAKGDIESVMKLIGEASIVVIQEAFETGGFGKWEPLKDSTIEKKGSSGILIDTGLLRKSISYEIGGIE